MLLPFVLAAEPAIPAIGAPAPPPAEEKSGVAAWLDGDHATGEWWGLRTALQERGVTLDLAYTGEVFGDAHGGLTAHDAVGYRGEVDIGVTLETKKLGAWPGGRLFMLAQNGHGEGVSDLYVGAFQTVSNIEAPRFTAVSELWYEQTLFDGLMVLKLGKEDANRDFGAPRYGGNFINGAFGALPTVPMPSFPAPGLGGVILVTPMKVLAIRAAAYEGSPQIGSVGFDSAAKPDAGVFGIAGASFTHTFGADARHGGTTSLGAWHHNGPFPETRGPAGAVLYGNQGAFLLHDERIYAHPKDKDSGAGLHLFVRMALAPADWNNADRYLGGGAAYHALPLRDNDTIGVGFGAVHLEEPLGGAKTDGTELFVEAFYKARFTPWVSLEPDFQFFRHPGGDGRDAVVLGTRFKVKP